MKTARLYFLLLATVILWQPGRGGDTLSLAVNYAAFEDPGAKTAYVEIYCGLNRQQLAFIGSDTFQYLYAGVFLEAKAVGSDGLAVDSVRTYFLSQVKGLPESKLPGIWLYDYLPMRLAPGQYTVTVTAIDDVSKAAGHQALTITVPDFGAAGLVSSDLELAYDIREIDSLDPAFNQRLVKEDRLVIPNPTGRYHWGKDSLLFVYSELYGLDTVSGAEGTFAVGYRVKDTLGNDVIDFGGTRYPKPGSTAVLTKALDIRTLSPGSYHLLLEAIDLNSHTQALTSKAFTVINPEGAPPVTAPDAETMVNMAWYHLSEAEKTRVKELGPEGQVNFIRQFWRDLDDDPSNPENPIYDDIARRFVYANEQFSTYRDRQDGWKSDRGRVYITYGPPSKEEEEELPGTSYPMIKWDYYNINQGVTFIFVNDEKAGAADFRLVHSTHPREIHNSYWMEKYRRAVPEDDWQHSDDDN